MTQAELQAAGHDVGAAAYARLAHFVALLRAENRRVNLTAARTDADLWRGHVCDSLALWPAACAYGVRRLLDIGSGGGLPGLPLACVCPGLEVTLLDATRKKVAALERIIRGLELGHVRTVWGRAETLAHEPEYRERFDLVTARAVAPLSTLLEYAAGFVRPAGEAWFFKSAGAVQEEVSAATAAARLCQLEPAAQRPYRLSGDAESRLLIGYRKLAPLTDDLPRSPGRARKRPLGR